MFRFSRTVAIKSGGSMGAALKVAAEIATHLNKTYAMQMKTGSELFGGLRIHWYNDLDSLDAVSQFNAAVAQDKSYWEFIERMKPLVVEGSLRDRVVQLVA